MKNPLIRVLSHLAALRQAKAHKFALCKFHWFRETHQWLDDNHDELATNQAM
jgi:hypothetical protein